ncbi:hypothetical protein, partial [Burkholderia sp. SIMBA_019]|uniref:hypothetical protein n=1 Tax=Burkholderia sp. SIMBA_019 TaxID=3085765 RepID=UPI00397A2C4B
RIDRLAQTSGRSIVVRPGARNCATRRSALHFEEEWRGEGESEESRRAAGPAHSANGIHAWRGKGLFLHMHLTNAVR